MARHTDDEITEHFAHSCTGECECQHETKGGSIGELMRQSVVAEIFGRTPARRTLLSLLGTATALSLIDRVMPLGVLEAMAEEPLKPEKVELSIGFVPIVCSAPLLFAAGQGYFKDVGLDVELVKTPGWGAIRERLLKGDYDAAHVLSVMPIAMSLGIDTPAAPTDLSLIQNTNGQAIVLAKKHQAKRNPGEWKGFTFGVPFGHSMHRLLLCYFLAESGVDPDKDVTIKAVPPPEMVAQLKSGLLDGYLSPEPFCQVAVAQDAGFIHMLTKDIWDGHPCCGFSISRKISKDAPNTQMALLKAVIRAAAHVRKAENRVAVATQLSGATYLNQPQPILEAILTGTFPDGLGNTRTEPNRIDFNAVPYPALATWMLTQMKRWGMVAKDVNYQQISQQIFRLADAEKLLKEAGFAVDGNGRYVILGKPFDAASPDAYLASFAIKRS